MTRHPAASRAWFLRVKKGRQCNMTPNSLAGWLITGSYLVAMIGLSVFLLAGDDEPATAKIVSWAVVTAAMTAAFLIIAWRTSEPAAAAGSGGRGAGVSKPDHKIVIALLSAAAIIGGAVLGIGFDL